MKRIFAVILTFIMLVGAFSAFAVPVSAAGKETILIAGSDFQVSGNNTSTVEKLIDTLNVYGISKVDGAFFCGDYTLEDTDSNLSQYGIAKLKETFQDFTGGNMLFVQGNHDIDITTGLSKSGNNDPKSRAYGVYIIHEDQYPQYNWDNSEELVEKTAADLKKYLDEKAKAGWKKPIFVLSHVCLHWGNRTIKEGSAIYGKYLVDVLNEAGAKGLNVIFMYGHDHSGGYADYLGGGAIYFKKGDRIEVCTGEKKGHESRTINFTYMNAGYIGYYSTDEATADNAVTMSVFRIQEDGSVIITRYDTQGVHKLKSKGVWHSDWSQEGYHATPNTLEYVSSRKVTAADDVAVDPPVPVPTQATTTTAYEYTTTRKASSMVVNKQTTTAAQDGETDATVTRGEDSDTTAAEETTDPTAVEEETAETTKKKQSEKADTATAAIPWWAWLGMGVVALLLIGAVVAIILLSRPVK